MFKNRKAFTLAETLTTLMIIGIIATMTIPTLITGVEKQKREVMLKKIYSSMSVNIQTVINKANVETLSGLREFGQSNNANHVLADSTYLNIDSFCTNCFKKNGRDNEGNAIVNSLLPEPMDAGSLAQAEISEAFDADGNKIQEALPATEETDANFQTYRLRNGSWLAIYDYEGNCIEQVASVTENSEMVDLCGIIVFDVNAEKAPNRPGEDRFAYYISDKAINGSYLIPFGYRGNTDRDNSSQYNSSGLITSALGDGECTSGTMNGYNCTAQVMMNNWKIDY